MPGITLQETGDRKTPKSGMRHTLDTLVRDLRALGLVPGDVVFVHSSFRSLGMIEGGAQTIVAALESAVGADGLILMPSFNLIAGQDNRAASWHIQTTPSTVGWLTEFFRQMPGTVRSDHYSHSVAARGKDAASFVAGHRDGAGMLSPWDRAPWGRTYGVSSPMVRAYDRNGNVLMLGVDYQSSTYIHLVEVMYWNDQLAQDEKAPYPYLDREKLGAFWDRTGHLMRGQVGDAACRCFCIRAYVDALLKAVRDNPDAYKRVQSKKHG